MMRPDAARELRDELDDPWSLVDRLGLIDGRASFQRQAGGVLIRCPAHPDRTPSCSVRVGSDGTVAARCHACGWTGDALSLVAVASGLDVRRDFPEVIRRAAELAGRWDLLDIERTPRARTILPPRPRPAPQPERTYPPLEEVNALLDDSMPVSEDHEATAMLAARGIDGSRLENEARVLRPDARLPGWAAYRGRSWTATGHRLVLPVVDVEGAVRSVRAWRVVEGESPKRLPPAGHLASGLVLADAFAVAMLRGTYAPPRVVIVEGEPDFLTACLAWGHVLTARIGLMSGAWSYELAARIPDGTPVSLWTDDDTAGERYADDVATSLRGRCPVMRAGKAVAA